MSRNPIKIIFNYPPAIIERCDSLGLVDAGNKPGGVAFHIKGALIGMALGIPAALVAGIIVILL